VVLEPNSSLGNDVISTDLHIFVTGDSYLDSVIHVYEPFVTIHRLDLQKPMQLAAAARDWLVHSAESADLFLYSEDDLVYADPYFIDKTLWFLHRSHHRVVLMPHRFEVDPLHPSEYLYIDGPLGVHLIDPYYLPRSGVAKGRFLARELVEFDLADNPHSGCFAISEQQRAHLQKQTLPLDGFIGPLESAATLTVLAHWPIMKPSWHQANFLQIEHAHRSFVGPARRLRSGV
jgi:hypothetical protein